jgi:hypothetical protein
VICGNGTQIFAPDGTPFHEQPIPREIALEALRLARDAGFAPIVYVAMGLLAAAWDANVEELLDHHEPVPEIIPDLDAALRNARKPYKLLLMNQDPDAVIAFQRDLERAFEGRAQVVSSGLKSVVEVMPLGVTKGTALRFILDRAGIALEETMTFGDNCNDVDLIRLAGIGVAMGHSPQGVRDGADYVTGTNDEDGVGHAIRRFVLDAVEAK